MPPDPDIIHPKMARSRGRSRAKPKQKAKEIVALSDDEQSDLGDISMPFRAGPPSNISDDLDGVNGDVADVKSDPGAKSEPEDDDEDDNDDDEDDEIYVVEAIKKHMLDAAGELKFHVKWEGYDKKADMTWEPEENLAESASEILEEYYNKIGGKEKIFEETEKATKGKKRGRQPSKGGPTETKRARKNGTHPSDTTPPKTQKAWSPPSGSWEDEIEDIDTCTQDAGTGKITVYLNWLDGHKTRHEASIIYKKCPQKMLQFYEKHVTFKQD